MLNLHQRYNHYINNAQLKHDDVNEHIIAYGWDDDGTNIIGHYVLTENHLLHYDLNDQLTKVEQRNVEALVQSTRRESK